ncbi:MAG: ferritin-like domain-containing protein [Bdellovibrionales bacterium]|nr:ferritin-like domain-containing protein [Bdellovibrionales bacterium]
MMDQRPTTSETIPTISALAAQSPTMREMLEPQGNASSKINDKRIRRLYLQATSQQWFAPTRIHFDEGSVNLEQMDPEKKRILIKFNRIFYTLEKMGLTTIQFMMPKAVNKLKSQEAELYLSCQGFDEARHVFTIEAYLRKLGAPPVYDRKLHKFSQIASGGPYRVENWLFSTLFSENFASTFLRLYKAAEPDPIGVEMCRQLLVDESRHLHFLHNVLPDILDRLSIFGRTYVKASQYFIMKLTESISRTLTEEGAYVGIDRRTLLEEAFENVERAYEKFGVTRDFLWFPNIKTQH